MKDISDTEKKLELMDRELHSMLAEIRSQKTKITLSELSEKISRVKNETDTSEIRNIRSW